MSLFWGAEAQGRNNNKKDRSGKGGAAYVQDAFKKSWQSQFIPLFEFAQYNKCWKKARAQKSRSALFLP